MCSWYRTEVGSHISWEWHCISWQILNITHYSQRLSPLGYSEMLFLCQIEGLKHFLMIVLKSPWKIYYFVNHKSDQCLCIIKSCFCVGFLFFIFKLALYPCQKNYPENDLGFNQPCLCFTCRALCSGALMAGGGLHSSMLRSEI